MKKHTFIHALLGATLLATTLTACGDNGSDEGNNTTTTPMTDPSNPPTSTDGTTTNELPTTAPGDTSTSTTDVDPDTTLTPTTIEPTTGDPDGFIFADDPYDAYTQIDRHGAVEAGTAGIKASQGLGFPPNTDIAIRDDYNASNPEQDAAMVWFDEIAASVTFFHEILDDDLMMAGATPATIAKTVAQAGPVILPDTIKYDPALPTGYPNGRNLADPVVDITLAAVLLDLDVHPITFFVDDFPLNPDGNDVPFATEFPFLAPPHL